MLVYCEGRSIVKGQVITNQVTADLEMTFKDSNKQTNFFFFFKLNGP